MKLFIINAVICHERLCTTSHSQRSDVTAMAMENADSDLETIDSDGQIIN